ncbi:T9SS type A sorting domain-containing protein [Caldithrix abyssi]
MLSLFNRLMVLALFSMFCLSAVHANSHKFSSYRQAIKPRLSAGGEFNLYRQKGLLKERAGLTNVHKQNQPSAAEALPFIDGPVTEAINYDTDKAYNGYAQTPPDNTGCVGPNHFLLAVNTAIEWYTKIDRILEHSEGLNDFFAATSPTDLFDPRVVYDFYNNRYVVIADEQSDTGNINYIHIAVSATDNPNDGWYFQRIATKLTVNGLETWLDFPGLAVSAEAIYITGNMFSFGTNLYQASRLWILDKGLYSGTDTSQVWVYDPSSEAGLSEQAFTLMPAIMSGPQPTSANGAVGTFLYSAEWDDGAGNDDLIAIFRVDDPLGTAGGPFFNVQFLNPGQIHDNSAGVPEAPQKDSNIKIDFGDDRAQSCFWRGDTLLGASTVNPPSGDDAGQATVFWFAVNTSDLNNLVLEQQGFIGANDIQVDAYTGYPAIAANYKGDIGIGFSVVGDSMYAGCYFTVHQSTDAPGEVQPTQLVHEGLDYYVRTGLPIHIGNRWGDYSAIALDPDNAYNFWVFNQYAWTRGDYDPFAQEDGRWATAFAKIDPSGIPAAVAGSRSAHQPLDFSLLQNFPNPFNPTTTISFRLGKQVNVELNIYNAQGKLVSRLLEGQKNAGVHQAQWDATGFSSGIYFITLKVNGMSVTRKAMLLK